MSVSFGKNGVVTTSPQDILNAKSWSSSGTWSGETITLAKASINFSSPKQFTLNPNDIYVIEFELNCSVYTSGSGVYVGTQFAYWGGDGKYTNQQSSYDFTNKSWGSFSNTYNTYIITNYNKKEWGYVKTYVCGSNVPTSLIPPPERSGGASSYGITCSRALPQATTSVYPNKMCFWQLGSNTLGSDTVFQFRNIKSYRLGSVEGDKFTIDCNGVIANSIVEF